ncbi:MAG: hypothetical protein ACKVWV_05120 [Planctomycetota bacterium]
MSLRVDFALARLAARRTLHPGVLATLAVVSFLALRHDFSPRVAGFDDVDGAFGRGLDRSGTWLALCAGVAPILVHRAAGTIGAWRTRDADWLAPRALGRASILVSTWLGIAVPCIALAVAIAALVELRVDGAGPTLRAAGSLPGPAPGWIDGGSPRAWRIDSARVPAQDGARVSLELGLGAGAGPAAHIDLRCTRGSETSSARVAIGTRGRVELVLPRGHGDLEFALAITDPDARALVLSDALELWLPIPSERAASLALAARLALALLAWTALALGFGAWLSAPTATGLVAALWIALWLADGAPAWIPGADAFDALATIGRGRAPTQPALREIAATIACVAVGLGLARAGLHHWRRAR